jgi:TonB family protein
MPFLELFPKPAQTSDETDPGNSTGVVPHANGRTNPLEPARNGAKLTSSKTAAIHPVKIIRTGRYGEMLEHELIHLLDALDDERARAQFRESVYISTIFCLAFAWFLFYGPRILWHQPQYRDPIALMKEHDKQLTYINPHPPALKPPPRPVMDRKTMEQMQKTIRETPPAPVPQAQQPPPPQQEAHTTAPPVLQPLAPLPTAPRPAPPSIEAPLPAAPHPNIAQVNPSAHDAIQDALHRGIGHGGDISPGPGPGTPLQAGATILTDTQGVDFNAYMRRLRADIERNWYPLIPEEANPPLSKRGIVGIRFIILAGGQIGDIKLETASGDVALDRAAWYGITSEGQFPPLPREFHGPQIELRVGFYYNTPLPQ